MEKFFKKINAFDSWFHERIFEPAAAFVCRWLKMSRINLIVGIYALAAAATILIGLRSSLYQDEQTTGNSLNLLFVLIGVALLGLPVFTLCKSEGSRIPFLLEVYFLRVKQVRPIYNLAVLIILLSSLVSVVLQPEKYLSEVLGMLTVIFLLAYFHSFDAKDSQEP